MTIFSKKKKKKKKMQLSIRRLRVVAAIKHWLEEDYAYLMENDEVIEAFKDLIQCL